MIEGSKPLSLAQDVAGGSLTVVSDSSNSGSSVFAQFIFGVILIWLALPMVWMNERKQVKMFKIVQKGRENFVEVQIDDVKDDNNYKLVHGSGRCTT